ncbi:TolC family protein, partial [Pseudomonas sp. MAFF212427]|nr:TolC family protein [Pseudomonas brassicae]
MNHLKLWAPSLLVLALAACAVGPDYQAPHTAAAHLAAADAQQAKAAFDRSRFDAIWWRQFDDPIPGPVGEPVAGRHRELRVAFARLKAAR